MGQEVEYTLSARNGLNAGNCIPAENVKIVQKGKCTKSHGDRKQTFEHIHSSGTIPQPKVLEKSYNGYVIRPIRCINPDQPEYCGLIQMKLDDGANSSVHEFGITSVKNKRDLLQKDDVVTFQLDEAGRAAEVSSTLKLESCG